MLEEREVYKRHWNRIQAAYSGASSNGVFSRSYRRILGKYFRFFIPVKSSVLEVGCADARLLGELPNSNKGGLDLSGDQIERAKKQVPEGEFFVGSGETFTFEKKWDYILISDTLNEAADAQQLLSNLHGACHEKSRLVLSSHNTLWHPILKLASGFGLKPKRPVQNWLSRQDIENLLELAGWETIRHETRVLIPHELMGLGTLINRFIAPFLPWFCLVIFFVAKRKELTKNPADYTVSVIVPARNEAGNIEGAIKRTPGMGKELELIFVEGNSQDNTWETIQELKGKYPERTIRAFQQTGKGKGDAMRLGYEKASGDIIMILDADLTVPPEDLPKFFDALISGKADFANGVRLVYPMEDEAMRFINMCGNKFFSLLFSWLLNFSIKDTLCGTKVFWKSDYHLIEENRSFFGEFDPFGDFDLIFGASKLNLKIRDIPIRYQSRVYGEPQIDRWRDGMLLFRMAWIAAKRLKFL